MWLDRSIAASFDTNSWAIPTRIYASPLELYEGENLTSEYLQATLKQLGYRERSPAARPGEFSVSNASVQFVSRGFVFPEGVEPSRNIIVEFQDARVLKIGDLNGDEELALARLEPVEIGSVHGQSFEDRVVVSGVGIPRKFLDMLVAVEDRRFYRHLGIDPIGILRAAVSNLISRDIRQGGSTITQQLIKNMYLSNERSWFRKLREALMAISLERRFSKQEILEAYANEIFLGQDGNRAIHGFGLAAEFYFGRPLAGLNDAELATLIGMVKAPSSYNPRRHPKASRLRRNTVLAIALKHGVIEENEYAAATQFALEVRERGPFLRREFGSFIDLVKVQLKRDYRDADLQSAGLNIHTTLDLQLQQLTQNTAKKSLAKIEAKRRIEPGSLQTAIVVADPKTSELRAVVGGRDGVSQGFNRAINASRSIGSLVKPIVYLSALQRTEEFNVLSSLDDSPVEVPADNGEVWTPKNYGGKPHGLVSLRQAFAQSYNLATVGLGLKVGVDVVARRLQEFGVSRQLDNFPSLLLGAIELSPLEVTELYQVIANDGFKIPLRTIRSVTNSHGATLKRYSPRVAQLIDSATAFLIKYLLVGAINDGTGRSARSSLSAQLPLAGKTGTSNDERDSWFAGFGSNFLSVVWVGRDDNGETGLTGASGALQIWTPLMRRLGVASVQFSQTEQLEWAWTTPNGSALVDSDCIGAVRIPLALPHGLEVGQDCIREITPHDNKEENLWDRFRGLFE